MKKSTTGIIENPNVYTASNDNTVKKLDSSGNTYSGSNDNVVKKVDSSGNEIWTFSGHNDGVWGIAVDPGDYPLFWT